MIDDGNTDGSGIHLNIQKYFGIIVVTGMGYLFVQNVLEKVSLTHKFVAPGHDIINLLCISSNSNSLFFVDMPPCIYNCFCMLRLGSTLTAIKYTLCLVWKNYQSILQAKGVYRRDPDRWMRLTKLG